MRVMALDIGDVRCGIAISDAQGRIATPLCVLPTAEVMQNAPSFRNVVQDWEPELLVSGLPVSLNGKQQQQALKIKDQATTIASFLNVPLEFCDERLSSAEAKRTLRKQGLTEKEMRGKVDMVAASIFLQTWLDANSK